MTETAGLLVAIVFLLAYIAVVVGVFAGAWKMYGKAGQPGWGAIVPFYNMYLLCRICGRPGWWFVLALLPVVNLVIGIILVIDLSRSFGRGFGTTVGLLLLSPVFVPILGFGRAQYKGPAAAM